MTINTRSPCTGLSLASAHGGYLSRPSFFRRLARRLADARADGWVTP
ncbi:hypothetical protein [Thiorhodococcus drewsii]|nr:hypothetical protein [Thiorhodococcus drewsii]